MADKDILSDSGYKTVLSYMMEARGPDNGADISDLDLTEHARSLCDWSADASSDSRQFRIKNDKNNLPMLEISGPDVPFLVDSVLSECFAQNAEVRVLFHPVIIRDKEAAFLGQQWSLIQVHLGPLSDAEQARLSDGVGQTLDDLEQVIADFPSMLARMRQERERLAGASHLGEYDRAEALAFLDWLANGHFVFLGARTYRFEIDQAGYFVREEPIMVEGANLGILRDVNRNILSRGDEPTMLTGPVGDFLQSPEPLIVAKSTMISRVHRRVRPDYIGVKHYDERGHVVGETRFLGLFTADAYEEAARNVPLIRRRLEQVIALSGAKSGGHTAKAYGNILESWPRDELFQTDAKTMAEIVQGVVPLMRRPQTRLFVRRDQFDRFVSAIVYVPRDAYDSDLRSRIIDLLANAFDAGLLSFQPSFDAGALVRLHIQLALAPGHIEPDLEDLQNRLAKLATRWEDAFHRILVQSSLEEHARDGASFFINGFNAAYREAFSPETALRDVAEFAELTAQKPIRLRVYKLERDEDGIVRAKIYSRGVPISLSQSVPVFENMGLSVDFEIGYPVRPSDKPREDAPDKYWVHDLAMRHDSEVTIDFESITQAFQDAFFAIWMGKVENDGFNRLIFEAGADWREADLLRALSAYRHQSGKDPAVASQIRSFAAHPGITANILKLFHALFKPEVGLQLEERNVKAGKIADEIKVQLASVNSLEEDRVLRRTVNLILAIQRTNFYCERSGPLAFKIASAELEAMPRPLPYREIFVAGPAVQGVHLRFGPVARGGLRWSDRADDFRTEVLGLVKAQQVKNAVIVPVGSKGGFYPKQLPKNGSREEVLQAGITAYRAFITALLELTDNLVNGDVKHPDHMVIRDGADPYLVVAADKGTATFSDIANEISTSRGFWLGDAFASGGSAGYDHKAMGITARGAWEAVKRHFLEAGKNIQTEPFTVLGVGDMSGDVFGNGMLLSKEINLVAAFNHMHIFVDPHPADSEKMWAERERLFKLPRSGWADYDTSLISKGGGVFERAAKSVPLSDEIKALSGLSGDTATPDELINALLKASVDLLWFGGIGTYVRASHESDQDVGDRTNNGIRVKASELRAKVVGEGANLGITQAARVEFAAGGGRINTDAIDNSAGVDSSDHEVNIKILVSESIRRGELDVKDRNALLSSMTGDVARHVLAHNTSQTKALSLIEARVKMDHDEYERVMQWLEDAGALDRMVEGLPASAEMKDRKGRSDYLTRPELAVLLAWSKITLFNDLISSHVPDNPFFTPVLEAYFPSALGKYKDAMLAHRLKREIISTVLANRFLDVLGPVALLHMREASGRDNAACVLAFEIARTVLDMPSKHAELDAADNKIDAGAKLAVELSMASSVKEMAKHIARADAHEGIESLIDRYREGFKALEVDPSAHTTPYQAARFERAVKQLVKTGAAEKLARNTLDLTRLVSAIAAIDIAATSGEPLDKTAYIYSQLGTSFRIDRLKVGAEEALDNMSHWERMATNGLLENLSASQAAATQKILDQGGDVSAFLKSRSPVTDNLTQRLRRMDMIRDWSFAKFSLAIDAVRAALVT